VTERRDAIRYYHKELTMLEIFSVMKIVILCGFALVGTFLVLLSWPESQLRSVLMPVIGWAVAIFCGLYCISPVDGIPECIFGPLGLFDDAAALAAGIAAGMAAYRAGKEPSPPPTPAT
jgi:uncharacterized membrane protein YkvA (DUF1232 family)